MVPPTSERPISGSSVAIAVADLVSAELDGEAVILHLESGVYYSLDQVGAHIWVLIQQPRTINEIRDAILEEYEVAPDRCERDIVKLIEQLVDAGLVEIRSDQAMPRQHRTHI